MTGRDGTFYEGKNPGLTKREYIAVQMMQGLIGEKDGHVDGKFDAEDCAVLAIKYTDALIAELNKQDKLKPSELTEEEIAELKANDEDL